MPIGVKETQEIIRQAAVLSRNEPAVPARLDPSEAGMATGPRRRRRALMRIAPVPDYLEPGETAQDEWQKLDDDIYKFLHLRRDQFGRMDAPPSHQFVSEVEARLKQADPEYEFGTYLGLLRQAADLDQTRQTYVTASEKGTFHALARRIEDGRLRGEYFDPEMVRRYRELLESNHPTTNRGLADLFRLVARASRIPLIGNLRDAPALSISVILYVIDLAVRFNQRSLGKLEFQVGPMDVFLGARAVLFNRSVSQPTLSMVRELVLEEKGLYHEDLMELLEDVGVFGSELTLLMPDSLAEEGFSLRGARYNATELILAAGARLSEAGGPVERALATLADALVHKVQQQDGHKDGQIRSILGHFNRLLHGERRSAQRLTEERQQARFDYMTAIRKAGELAKGMQTGEFRALAASAPPEPILPVPRSSPRLLDDNRFDAGDLALAVRALESQSAAARSALPPSEPPAPGFYAPDRGFEQVQPAAMRVGGISAREYEALLSEWDDVLGRVRRKLTTRSPLFKSLASQLAKVRALDTCMAYGVTPSGGRAAARLARLLQEEGLRDRLGLPAEAAEALEDAFGMQFPGFLAAVEALITTVYGFRPVLHGLQFRLRDRLADAKAGRVETIPAIGRSAPRDLRETVQTADAAGYDEAVLRLVTGCLRLGLELAGGRAGGNAASDPAAMLGNSDPFLAYCLLLWRARASGAPESLGPEEILARLPGLGSEDKMAMRAKYQAWIGPDGKPSALIPGLGETPVREGWGRGFERGYMAEIRRVFEGDDAGSMEARLLERLTAIQLDIDRAHAALEGEKLRLIRERVRRVLE